MASASPYSSPKPRPVSHNTLHYLPQYLRRILKWRQMDLEFTFWQMLYLCVSPAVVYRHTTYHKQTKNQWARDDPAFVVITCGLVAVAAAAYCAAFAQSFVHSLFTITSAVLVDYLLLGVVLATSGWLLSNRYLRTVATLSHSVEQRVEWLYAFDVHCNAYFPVFIALYGMLIACEVVQFFFTPLLLAPGFIPVVLSNTLYAAALSYYHYTQFLGYNALPFLERTELFLYPIAGIALLTPFAIVAGFNPCRSVLGIYFSTVS